MNKKTLFKMNIKLVENMMNDLNSTDVSKFEDLNDLTEYLKEIYLNLSKLNSSLKLLEKIV